MSPKSLAQVIDATGAAAGENNANVAKMEWGARGGETWQQKEEDKFNGMRSTEKEKSREEKLVLDDDDENDEEEEHETVKKSPKKATGKPATSVMSEIASQVTTKSPPRRISVRKEHMGNISKTHEAKRLNARNRKKHLVSSV